MGGLARVVGEREIFGRVGVRVRCLFWGRMEFRGLGWEGWWVAYLFDGVGCMGYRFFLCSGFVDVVLVDERVAGCKIGNGWPDLNYSPRGELMGGEVFGNWCGEGLTASSI